MEARLVRDKLQECQRVEGVNYHENCRQLSEQYLTMLKENKVCGSNICLFLPRTLTMGLNEGQGIQTRRCRMSFPTMHGHFINYKVRDSDRFTARNTSLPFEGRLFDTLDKHSRRFLQICCQICRRE